MEKFNRDYFCPLVNASLLGFENIDVNFDETETSKVAKFIVTSKDNNQGYHVKRTFRDFKRLRDTILSIWGGMLIPSLSIQNTSFKSIKDSKEIAQIKLMTKGLKNFLIKCAKNKQFSSLQAFQTFLTDNQAYNPPRCSLKEIESTITNFYSNLYTEQEIIAKIETLKNDRKVWEEHLTNIKELNSKLKSQKNMIDLNENISELNDLSANNIFSTFYNWADTELLNINTILETYSSLIDFQILLETLQEKVERFSLKNLENWQQSCIDCQKNLKIAISIISNLLFIFPQSSLILLLTSKVQSLNAFTSI